MEQHRHHARSETLGRQRDGDEQRHPEGRGGEDSEGHILYRLGVTYKVPGTERDEGAQENGGEAIERASCFADRGADRRHSHGRGE